MAELSLFTLLQKGPTHRSWHIVLQEAPDYTGVLDHSQEIFYQQIREKKHVQSVTEDLRRPSCTQVQWRSAVDKRQYYIVQSSSKTF